MFISRQERRQAEAKKEKKGPSEHAKSRFFCCHFPEGSSVARSTAIKTACQRENRRVSSTFTFIFLLTASIFTSRPCCSLCCNQAKTSEQESPQEQSLFTSSKSTSSYLLFAQSRLLPAPGLRNHTQDFFFLFKCFIQLSHSWEIRETSYNETLNQKREESCGSHIHRHYLAFRICYFLLLPASRR